MSYCFSVLNFNKSSPMLDMEYPRGKVIFMKLIPRWEYLDGELTAWSGP